MKGQEQILVMESAKEASAPNKGKKEGNVHTGECIRKFTRNKIRSGTKRHKEKRSAQETYRCTMFLSHENLYHQKRFDRSSQ